MLREGEGGGGERSSCEDEYVSDVVDVGRVRELWCRLGEQRRGFSYDRWSRFVHGTTKGLNRGNRKVDNYAHERPL